MPKYRITQIEDYEPLVGSENVQRIREKTRKFTGLRVANFNSTYYGGAWPRRVLQKIAHTVLVNGSPATSNHISIFLTRSIRTFLCKNKIGWSRPFRVRATRQLIASQLTRRRYWLFARPITPQAMRAPESPAGCDLRSSAFA